MIYEGPHTILVLFFQFLSTAKGNKIQSLHVRNTDSFSFFIEKMDKFSKNDAVGLNIRAKLFHIPPENQAKPTFCVSWGPCVCGGGVRVFVTV